MKFLEHKIPPPLLMLGICVGMWAFVRLQPSTPPEGSIHEIAALILFFLAGIFGIPAFIAFGKAKTTIDPVHIDRPTALVTNGIYRITRNPMYLSLTCLIGSLAAFLANRSLAIGPAFFVLFITRFQIVPEELAMRDRFGREYDIYCEKVRRWI